MKNVNCGRVSGREVSEKLPGALVISDDMIYDVADKEFGGVMEYTSINSLLPSDSEFKVDFANEIFVTRDGLNAVCDAYDFGDVSLEELDNQKRRVLAQKIVEYPDYEFELIEGEFPIDVVTQSADDYNRGVKPTPILSTHVLLIKDFKKYLQNESHIVK